MAERLTFASKDGSEVSGVIALPSYDGAASGPKPRAPSEPTGMDKAPGLVLIQEWWGLNDHIRGLADLFAQEGFLTLAPDLYQGKVTADPNEAGQLMQALDRERALRDIAAATRFLLAHERCNGKVGVTGFCMGGAFSFSAAALIPELSAAVPFY